jgi:hypothetical protein
VTTTTTTTSAMHPPTDPLGQRCQAIVDALLAEWKPVGKAPMEAEGVCRTRDEDPFLATRAGYAAGYGFVVRYPLERVPEPYWDRAWRATAAHEIGHTWSLRLRDDQRQSYAAIRGLPAWDPEDYADVFGAVVAGSSGPDLVYIEVPPTPAQVTALCAEGLLPC